jgi:hypothetical protein
LCLRLLICMLARLPENKEGFSQIEKILVKGPAASE